MLFVYLHLHGHLCLHLRLHVQNMYLYRECQLSLDGRLVGGREKGELGEDKGKRERGDRIRDRIPLGNQVARTHKRNETVSWLAVPQPPICI